MAGTEEPGGSEQAPESDCKFEWDDDSKLYFHASSGFYHDPNAGWYYSSRDGLYYTFENGSYVLLTCNKEEPKACQCTSYISSEPIQDGSIDVAEDITCDGTENLCPPSEWLEETLIDLYLSGYSSSEVIAGSSSTTLHTNGEERSQVPCEVLPDHLTSDKLLGCHNSITYHHVEEGERIPEVVQDAQESSHRFSEEDDEKSWQAQFGQVVQSGDDGLPSFPAIDLWDWEMVMETVKKRQVARLIGRLVKRSSKLHPSVSAGGGLLKSAAIHDVHIDLVRVASGKVYRLRSPNTRYLSSLSEYDASNPTKDWGFPDIYINMHSSLPISLNQTCGSDISNAVISDNSSATLDRVSSTFDKHNNRAYRDRAAERRMLHGSFSIGPGQKDSLNNFYVEGSSSESADAEAAAAEAMNMSFGTGSYARRIIEKMGWKDGEALGSSTKGILEPLQAVGNKGLAGLGWNRFCR